jgi:hypothetical protein
MSATNELPPKSLLALALATLPCQAQQYPPLPLTASSLTSMDSLEVRPLSSRPMFADRRFNSFSRYPHPRSGVMTPFQHGENRPCTTL